jgi:hypothetical protein
MVVDHVGKATASATQAFMWRCMWMRGLQTASLVPRSSPAQIQLEEKENSRVQQRGNTRTLEVHAGVPQAWDWCDVA